jgi:L-asparagine transporter-like permease
MSHAQGNRMPELSRSLQPRHITMISIGGMIGAGLFVSSSAAIAATGPAIVLSYLITGTLVLLVMRMLGEMARQLFWSVVSLAVAVGAFLIVDTWRKARAVARTAPAAPGADGS